MRGLTLRIADDQPTFWDKVERGAWEPEMLALLERQLASGTVFLVMTVRSAD